MNNTTETSKVLLELSSKQTDLSIELEKIRTILTTLYEKTNSDEYDTTTPEKQKMVAFDLLRQLESLNNLTSISIDYTDKCIDMCNSLNDDLDKVFEEVKGAESLSN